MNNNTVSFTKNGGEIKKTYLNIINNEVDGLKWLVITNDATNELFVEETGESLKDFVDFLKEDATKVKYGICKTIPPGSDVEKLLFIGLCSDFLSIKPKMGFMKNLQIVRDDLFNNYHVLMEIRDESDLNYESISKRLGDAAGARYSIQTGNSKGSLLHGGVPVKSQQRAIPKSFPKPFVPTSTKTSSDSPQSDKTPTPVVQKTESSKSVSQSLPTVSKSVSQTPPAISKPALTAKKFTSPTAAVINSASKKVESDDDDDWSEPPLEEKEIGHKGRHTTSNWTPIGKVDLKKLIAEEKAKADPRLVKESFKPAFVAKKKIEIPVEELKEHVTEEEVEEEEQEVEEESEKEESKLKQASNDVEEKEENEEVEEKEATPRSESDRQADIEAYLAKMTKKTGASNFDLKKPEKKETTPPVFPLRSSANNSTSSFTPQIIKPQSVSLKKDVEENVEEVKVSKQNYKKFGIPLPGLHVEEPKVSEPAKDSDDGWSDEEKEDEKPVVASRVVPALPSRTSSSPAPISNLVEEKSEKKISEPVEEDSEKENAELAEEEENEISESSEEETEDAEEAQPKRAVPPPPPTRAPVQKIKEEKAKALFDYEADESNEISFKQGEVITKIEKDFEDWWSGENEAGETGVFPSNYVALL
ncbi:hypothetical protein QEN19_000946 [Hanseniaspora menglaensis]